MRKPLADLSTTPLILPSQGPRHCEIGTNSPSCTLTLDPQRTKKGNYFKYIKPEET